MSDLSPLQILTTALSGLGWRQGEPPDEVYRLRIRAADISGHLEVRRITDDCHEVHFRHDDGIVSLKTTEAATAALFERARGTSAPRRLFETIREAHGNDAWVHINPMYEATLRLAITSRMQFAPGDIAQIVHDYSGGHWLGPDREAWYALAVERGDKSAVVAAERWLGREPFLLDGERVFVGKDITWKGERYRVTSIEANLVRAKREEFAYNEETKKHDPLPATLIEIPRAGFEDKIAADKAAAKAKREKQREAERADPIELRPLYHHFDSECARSGRGRPGAGGTYIDPALVAWARGFGTDYQRAYKECTSSYWLGCWLRWLDLCVDGPKTNDCDAIRKRYTWPKVEQAIFRLARKARGLPLKDAP